MKKIFHSLWLLFFCSLSSLRAEKPYYDDNKRYLAVMVINDGEEHTFSDVIQAGKNAGFNAVYITVRWDAIKCHNAACMIGNSINPNWNPANRYWAQIDGQVAQAKSLGMKIAFRIHLGSADITNFGAPAQRSKYLWGDNNYMRQPNGSEDLGGYAFRQFSFSSMPAIDSAKSFLGEVLNRYGYLEDENNFLFYSVTLGGAQEMEYSGSYLLDYSTASTNEYNTWYQSKYGTNYPFVPQDFTSVEGKKWYMFRHKKMKEFLGTMLAKVKDYNPSIKFVNEFGSAFDAISASRGTLGFKSLGAGIDGVKVNDAEEFDHRFSMDIIRTNMPGKWIMNEMLTQASIVQSNPSVYSDFLNQSFAHGAKFFSVVTSPDQIASLSGIYTQVVNTWITPNFSAVTGNGSVSYTFDEILHANFNGNRFSTSSRNIYQEWVNAYNSNPSNGKPVNIYLDDNELNGNCTTPSAPSLSASPATITTINGSSTLTATGCSGGTITWSDNLGTGSPKTVTPASTKTYTATCTLNGCTSSSASVTVTVTTPTTTQCLESELMNGNGPITGDPNASNGNTRGAENNYNHYVDYALTGIPSAGSYAITLRYYSSAAPIVSVQVNGGSSQTVNLANSNSWNITWTEQTFNVTLAAGNNTLRIQGTGGGSCRQDKICVAGGGGGCTTVAPSLQASPSTISSGASTTLSASGCSGTVTWSDGLGTGSSKQVSPTATKTYTATCTANGCTSPTSSVTVTVIPPVGPYSECRESELMNGDGAITSDPNASNGSTRGLENSYNHYVDYVFSNIPSAGTYRATLRYYSSAAPTVGVQINGGSTQTVNLVNSASWNIAWTTQQVNITLVAGSNTIRITGTGGGSCRQDQLCVETPGSQAVLVETPDEFSTVNRKVRMNVFPNPSNGMVNANFYLEKGRKATLVINDLQGRTIFTRSITGNGMHNEKVYLSNKASGILVLRLEKGDAIEIQKINIVR